jgi:hypothetical protein
VMTNSALTGVAWSILEGSLGGSITSTGSYTAPLSPGIYHVVARSVYDYSSKATTTVTVACPSGYEFNGTACVLVCSAASCSDLGKNCGSVPDGCGGMLSCGTCAVGYTCTVSNVCACVPSTCAAQGKNCGTISDGCGGTLSCGTCSSGYSCSTSNVCACVPTTCAAQGKNCGSIPDGCGGTLQCGSCQAGYSCSSNVCRCTPQTCSGQCGIVSDGCGGTLDCGTCPANNWDGCRTGYVCCEPGVSQCARCYYRQCP